MADFPILTWITIVPLIFAAMTWCASPRQRWLAQFLGVLSNLVTLALTAFLWRRFDSAAGELQFVERHAWIPSIQVDYFLGIDGLGLAMVSLTSFVLPFALLASTQVAENRRSYVALMLFLQAGLYGAFTALNFVHWFLFWELTLIPAYFLIRLWGGANRTPAANQFFIYTMVGSVTLLLSMLAVYVVTGSWDFMALAEKGRTGELAALLNVRIAGWYDLSPRALALVVFAGAFLGFAVKVPLMPFHSWLPSTYAEAPIGVSMVLTGVMSKMGVYGFLRILLPLFSEQIRWVLTPLLWLAVATILLSAWSAMAQRDLRRIVAYSSINHLGYCLLGIFAAAKITDSDPRWTLEKAAVLNGVIVQMFNHGLTASALFYFVGQIEARTGRRGLDDFGGLRRVAPVFCGLMGIALFASLGMPGLNGFVGEFLIFKGAFPLAGWASALSAFGLLITAIFFLTILQRVWSGPLSESGRHFPDLTFGERLVVLPVTLLLLLLGIFPQLLIGKINQTVIQMVEGLRL